MVVGRLERIMFQTIGFPELLIILVILLLLFGSKKLPEFGSSIGRAITEFKRGVNEGTRNPEKSEELMADNSVPQAVAEAEAQKLEVTPPAELLASD
jgi:sec-independent protein translocase protein TatA